MECVIANATECCWIDDLSAGAAIRPQDAWAEDMAPRMPRIETPHGTLGRNKAHQLNVIASNEAKGIRGYVYHSDNNWAAN